MTKTSSTIRRFRYAIGALALTMTGLALGAGPAGATGTDQLACNYPPGSNACLFIGDYLNGRWQVHIGVDERMSPAAARDLLACGGPYRAELWGEDGERDEFLSYVPLTAGWPAVGPNGIGIEFNNGVSSVVLNEDDGTDEVYARVFIWDCYALRYHVFQTGTVAHNF